MISPSDLGKHGFYEFRLGMRGTTETEIVFANFALGCVLVPNGYGYIPYINMCLLSTNLSDGVPCTMINEPEQLDSLLARISTGTKII